MKIQTFSNTQDLSRYGADVIADRIQKTVADSGRAVLGLVGGKSVSGIYARLAAMDFPAWQSTHFFLADERRVPLDDPESNFRLIREHLLTPLLNRSQIGQDNIHAMDTSLPPAETIRRYRQELEDFGGRFDLVLLSSGEDNHIAGLFPGKSYSSKEYFSYFEDSPKPPSRRFTATPALLSRSAAGMVLFTGPSKAAALMHFMDRSTEKTLAEKTLESIPDLILLTDQRG